MIVLTQIQRDAFMEMKKSYDQNLKSKGCDFIPIAIKGGLYILPEDILLDERFASLKDKFTYSVRVVDKETELFTKPVKSTK